MVNRSDGRRPCERLIIDYHLHPDGAGSLHLGPALPAWLGDLVSCDADIRTWVHTADGSVDLGRRQRTVDARLRKVVEHRDGGCRIPGCGATRWLVIHHLRHWSAGGPTDTANLIALCAEHHRQIHRGELRVAGNPDAGTLAITAPDGRPFGPSPPRPPGTHPPATAATHAGLPTAAWANRSGERADWRWLIWEDPTHRGSDG